MKEFDWVVFFIGKFYLEMNMVRYFIDLNWDVFVFKFVSEFGFVFDVV